MNTTTTLLLLVLWGVLFGFVLGLMIALLLWHLLEATRRVPVRKRVIPLAFTGNVRRTLGVLQQVQVLIGQEAAERDPSLADLACLIRRVQRVFGRTASLERVIQALVAQDLEQQLARRQRPRRNQRDRPREVAVHETV